MKQIRRDIPKRVDNELTPNAYFKAQTKALFNDDILKVKDRSSELRDLPQNIITPICDEAPITIARDAYRKLHRSYTSAGSVDVSTPTMKSKTRKVLRRGLSELYAIDCVRLAPQSEVMKLRELAMVLNGRAPDSIKAAAIDELNLIWQKRKLCIDHQNYLGSYRTIRAHRNIAPELYLRLLEYKKMKAKLNAEYIAEREVLSESELLAARKKRRIEKRSLAAPVILRFAKVKTFLFLKRNAAGKYMLSEYCAGQFYELRNFRREADQFVYQSDAPMQWTIIDNGKRCYCELPKIIK